MNKKYPQDEAILLKIRNGDQAALKELHSAYWPPFRAYCNKSKGLDEEAILSIYARSFTIFYHNIVHEKINPPLQSSLKTYLFGIGNKSILKYWNDTYRKRVTSVDEWHEKPGDHLEPDINRYYEQNARAKLVKKLLDQLDEPCQQLLQLSFLEENADDAIAAKMDIPSTGAVRQRRFKCLEKIRKLLNQQKKAATDG